MIKKETDLGLAVADWLKSQHWEVYQEVRFGGVGSRRADIVAVQDNIVWVVECKTRYTLGVLQQAQYWEVHYRSVAVPRISVRYKNRHRDYSVAKRYYKVGVLEVEHYAPNDWHCREIVPAPLQRHFHERAKYYRSKLTPLHKTYAQAGSNEGGYLTPYRITMMNVQAFIEKNPGCTLQEIIDDLGKGHYKTTQSAKGSIRKALANWEDWCVVDLTKKPPRYSIYK